MKLIVGNQKTYLNKENLVSFIEGTKENWIRNDGIVICPSSLFINLYKDTNYKFGGQNVSKDKNGATTGEISASQLKSVGASYCIVGHSERRQTQNETDEDTNIKLQRLLEEDITPILCVGETLEEREQGKANEIVSREISGAFTNLDQEQIAKIIIAYEPIWAIGTGKVPTNTEIDEIITYTKEVVEKGYNANVLILYGGSVSNKNVDELNTIDSVDGYLIGGASVKTDDFNYIIKSVYK